VGFIEGAKVLLDAGAQINAETRLKETPLIFALVANQLEMVQFLIDSRTDIDRVGFQRRTPLFYCADNATAAIILAAGANVNSQNDEGATPLHCAAAEGFVDVAELLIENGAAVNGVNLQKVHLSLFKHLCTSPPRTDMLRCVSCCFRRALN
jgi:ankyrin repeat protein